MGIDVYLIISIQPQARGASRRERMRKWRKPGFGALRKLRTLRRESRGADLQQ